MLVVGRLIGKFDTRVFLIIGLALTALGLFLFSGMQLVVGQRRLMVAGLFQGLGSGLMMVPLSSMVFATLPRAFRNEGTALYAFTRNMGASLGISFLRNAGDMEHRAGAIAAGGGPAGRQPAAADAYAGAGSCRAGQCRHAAGRGAPASDDGGLHRYLLDALSDFSGNDAGGAGHAPATPAYFREKLRKVN